MPISSIFWLPPKAMRWRDFSSFCQVRGTFCQVLGFSAKFVACLPSLVQTLQSFCQVFCLSAKFVGTELAKNCQWFRVGNFLPTRSHSVQNPRIPTPMCAMAPSWQFFAKVSCWQRAQNLAEKPRTWQKQIKKAETGGKPDTERCKGIHPATSTS